MADKEEKKESGTMAGESESESGRNRAAKAVTVGLEDEGEGRTEAGGETGGLSGKALLKKQEMELKMKKREEERLKKKEEEKVKKLGSGGSDNARPSKQLEKRGIEESILMQEQEGDETEVQTSGGGSARDQENIKEEILSELMQPSRSRIEKNLSKETINFDDLPIKASQKKPADENLDEQNEGGEPLVFMEKKENEGDAAAKRKAIEERMKKREEERKKKIEDAKMAKEDGKGEGNAKGKDAKTGTKGKETSSELTKDTDEKRETAKAQENDNALTLADEKPLKSKATLADEKPIGNRKPSSGIPFDEAPVKGSSRPKAETEDGGQGQDENAEPKDKMEDAKAKAKPVISEDDRPLKGAKKSNMPEEYPPGYNADAPNVESKPATKKVVKKALVTKKTAEEEPKEKEEEEGQRPATQAVAEDERPLKGAGGKGSMMSEYPEGYEHGRRT